MACTRLTRGPVVRRRLLRATGMFVLLLTAGAPRRRASGTARRGEALGRRARARAVLPLRVHAMELSATPVRTRLPAEVAATATIPIGGIRAVLVSQESSPGTARRSVADQTGTVRVAIGVRRSRGLFAARHRTSQFRRHDGTGRLHDLPDALSGQAHARADRGQALALAITRHDGCITPIHRASAHVENIAALHSQPSALATHAAVA
jgi:hypothetical protein